MNKTLILMSAVALAVSPAAAARSSTVKGECTQVEQHVRTANGGEEVRLTIRTRQGEEMQLHLGQSSGCEDCYRIGDQVRARLAGNQGAGGSPSVEWIKVRRQGEMFTLSNRGGTMVRRNAGGGQPGAGNDAVRSRDRDRLRDTDGRPEDARGPMGSRGGGPRRRGGV